MSKPKILNILPFLPWPLVSGGHNGCYHSIEAIKNDVDLFVLFPFDNNQKEIGYMRELWSEVTWIPYYRKSRIKRKWQMRVKSLCFKMQNIVYENYNQRLEWDFELDSERYENEYLELITNIIKKYQIEIVQVEFPAMMSLVLWLPDTVKKVFVHHELRFVKNELILKNIKNKDEYYEFYKRKNKNEEIALLNKYDYVVTFSSVDTQKLIEAGVLTPCTTSFLVVNQRKLQPFVPAKNRITFLGSGGHLPNAEGLKWFLDSEWDNLLSDNPDIVLEIVGNWLPKQKKKFSKYKNVRFLGFVENLYDTLAGSVMIVPLTIGSGIRIKILECTSLNVPFITTSVGVEGLPFVDGKNCIIEDDAGKFREKLMNLLNNSEEQRKFALSSYEQVQKEYSQEALKISRMNIYKQL